jgi:hypothetical protein
MKTPELVFCVRAVNCLACGGFFVLLDRYDRGAIADILKFLVLAIGLLTIVHKLLPLLGLDL